MGVFVYENRDIEVDDRVLAHLQVVIVDKLRRRESFPLTLDDDGRSVTMWLAPATALQFVFHGNRVPKLNRNWLERLAESAGSANGLQQVPEPPDLDAS
ncbi:ATP-dependent DNA ligase [Agromyces sp. G08B096]|uniref:ATP-dependent DNA ligase n=1 Tax=Agromyces sp. G08B096 TaxID=3156399 RepID=A0AAU7W6B6_9MICO